jgi:3-deoxy-manno-octulosonate cytidylyltransferase (CMP-KDO synthetase)
MNQNLKVILAIPARLNSSRLPRKLVAEIGGNTMIGLVLERCLQATAAHATALCTDSQELADQASKLEVPSLLTSADCTSGRDRIASVALELLVLLFTCWHYLLSTRESVNSANSDRFDAQQVMI